MGGNRGATGASRKKGAAQGGSRFKQTQAALRAIGGQVARSEGLKGASKPIADLPPSLAKKQGPQSIHLTGALLGEFRKFARGDVKRNVQNEIDNAARKVLQDRVDKIDEIQRNFEAFHVERQSRREPGDEGPYVIDPRL